MSRHLFRLAGLVIALHLGLMTLGQHATPARADHEDGNIFPCGPVPCSVNYWLVEAGQIRVCDNSPIVTTSRLNAALGIWNTGLGATMFVNSCTNWGIEVIDVGEGACVLPAFACAQVPSVESTQLLQVRMEPDSEGSDDRVTSIVASELGHNLGFDHSSCPTTRTPCRRSPRPPMESIAYASPGTPPAYTMRVVSSSPGGTSAPASGKTWR